MTVRLGSTFKQLMPGGRWIKYRVRVVRYAPFPYAEVEPLEGGKRRQVPLHVLEDTVGVRRDKLASEQLSQI